MLSNMKNIRSPLWPIFDRSKAEIAPETEALLFGQLGVLGKNKTIAILHIWRPIALELAQMKSARERQRLIQNVQLKNLTSPSGKVMATPYRGQLTATGTDCLLASVDSVLL